MFNYDVIVVGAGHAGCEAAIAASRLGAKVLFTSLNLDNIALMPCNPAVGGPAKSNLVREIDALGGVMADVTDSTYMQFKMLNSSKGPAVRALRAQSDKKEYKSFMRNLIESEENISLKQTQITGLLSDGDKITGVEDELGLKYFAKSVILTTGTSLEGKIYVGLKSFRAGRLGEQAAIGLSESLLKLGLPLKKLKTGTPARVDNRTIDYSKLIIQPPDEPDDNPYYSGCLNFFSFKKEHPIRPMVPCYLTKTNEKTHKVIKDNLDKSPMYQGMITGIGPRYCPSIEDKVVRFAHNPSHHIFIEPEGSDTYETYVQGFSTSLPIEVQIQMLQSLPGLENVSMIKPAYAVEYNSVPAVELSHSLMTKKIKGLFLAGQINGTSGYEEAAAQGLIAGINAVKYANNETLLELDRASSYIGTLIDDLVTKDLAEPYRMLTSRSEYRLILRQDNADFRLMELGKKIGLVREENYQRFEAKKAAIEEEIENLRNTKISPTEENKEIMAQFGENLEVGQSAYQLLKRPNVDFKVLNELNYNPVSVQKAEGDKYFIKEVLEQAEILIKYDGYIKRQEEQVNSADKLEKIKIPDDIDYTNLKQISTETREILTKIRPKTLGQALRTGGVKPADISCLMVIIEAKKYSSLSGK
ncbi:MAG: tRNA uridine-5-carboxymethylaminomethyl(34) synthesis enzyme MnmG [Candidatus Gastranaerophilales bacterium]|nr:tRNA uridine-5-carboxymethylaminomethyl(34) synthesis enzyme MnmG [Candidatus Gastranaerophilales bacterium]